MKGIMHLIRMLFGLVLLLAPALAFAGTVQLPQTGQTSCYDASGTVITCAREKGACPLFLLEPTERHFQATFVFYSQIS